MSTAITVTTFYSFTSLPESRALRAPILERMKALQVRGTITLAREGINATISGAREDIDTLLEFLSGLIPFSPTSRESHFATQPFKRSKVKVKPELISLGVASAPAQCVGQYVMPKDWNTLITLSDVLIIDTRNSYEFEMGHFDGALNPGTRNFKQMVRFTEKELLPVTADKRIALYCTGGIRCEKYSSYLVAQGFADVFHLQGGILAYLEQIPERESRWRGTCFVFDERLSVGHGLIPAQMAA